MVVYMGARFIIALRGLLSVYPAPLLLRSFVVCPRCLSRGTHRGHLCVVLVRVVVMLAFVSLGRSRQ